MICQTSRLSKRIFFSHGRDKENIRQKQYIYTIPTESYSQHFYSVKTSTLYLHHTTVTKLTPAMQQYVDLKAKNPDCILFFRLGDFYEMFREDAKLCAKLLDLTLTSKNKNAPNPIPMAGVPHHSAEKYIERLVGLGYKVAIAEQTSTPTPGKIVQREIASIITPGTYVQEGNDKHNFLCAITQTPNDKKEYIHIARGDFAE
jgi:DNA mismatch repair protein MutS